MITAFVMMKVERDRISAIPDEILNIPNVTEVYSVAGDYDIIAIVRVKEAEDLAKTVTRISLRSKVSPRPRLRSHSPVSATTILNTCFPSE